MAGKFIKRSEFPSNFDVRKYDVCEKWDIGLWAANLIWRVNSRKRIAFESHLTSFKSDLGFTDVFNDPEIMPKNILLPANQEDVLLGDVWPLYSDRVRDMSALEFFEMADSVANEEYEPFSAKYRHAKSLANGSEDQQNAEGEEPDGDALDAYHELKYMPYWKIIETEEVPEGLRPYPFVLAEVDLSASDEELHADFAEWLERTRKQRKFASGARLYTAEDMRKWSEMRVLAFIDLDIWLSARGLKATHKAIGDALFPDPDLDGTDFGARARRTVATYARSLTAIDNLRAMQSQFLKTARES
jgi:hypothetical protein